MKTVIVFTTGGTISSRIDKESGAAVPIVSGKELAGFLPELNGIQITIREVGKLGGSQVTPELIFSMASQIKYALEFEGYDGAVVTQGTDSVEESAYLLDLVLGTESPVVHTASMRSNSELGFEGIRNLYSAVRVAASDEAKGHGVLVVMNDLIYAANEVMKTDTVNPASFASPGRGPLGAVMRSKVVFFHKTLTRQHIAAAFLETRVPIVRVCLGMDGELIEAAAKGGARGLVLEGNGAGNIPERAFPAIAACVEQDLPVVLTSSCYQGIVDDIYGYPGGGYRLRSEGVLFSQGLTAPKARIKLMLALGAEYDQDQLRELFEYLC